MDGLAFEWIPLKNSTESEKRNERIKNYKRDIFYWFQWGLFSPCLNQASNE